MSAAADARCPEQGHEERRLRRRGIRVTVDGPRQRWECLAEDDTGHFFLGVAPGDATPVATTRMRCPDPRHADARVAARGARTTANGSWTRYRCVRPDGSTHHFQVLTDAGGSALSSVHFPPPCPEHEGSKVTRHGVYGKGEKQRQRYRCVPVDGLGAHSFTPPLSREAVEVGVESCSTCEELLSPHRGALTGARHTPWHLRLYARALNDLSLGSSYAAVSLMMRQRRNQAARHLLEEHGQELVLDTSLEGRSQSFVAAEGKGAWHLAADLVEQYAPLLFDRTMARVQTRERRLRASNDAVLAADPGKPLDAPIVYILDELPIWVRQRATRQLRGWNILAVVEVRWRPGRTDADYPRRENRLRLVRAYPRANAQAWRLVLDELGTRPDFIVADCSDAITNAVTQHYGAGAVGLIPSLFHVHRNIREGLRKVKGTTHTVEGRAVLVPELAKHLDVLTRDDLLAMTDRDWAAWWDALITEVAAVPAPVEKLLRQRRVYEGRVAAALPLLRQQPQLPASNAAIENRFRAVLDPFLTNRKQLYRNLARTNFLLDLAVCRAQGAFADLDEVTHLIKASNESAGGWAPAPRMLADAQPPGTKSQPYSSLHNPLLVPALADARLSSPTPPVDPDTQQLAEDADTWSRP